MNRMKYNSFNLAAYLSAENTKLNNQDKILMFSVRNSTLNISGNFLKKKSKNPTFFYLEARLNYQRL